LIFLDGFDVINRELTWHPLHLSPLSTTKHQIFGIDDGLDHRLDLPQKNYSQSPRSGMPGVSLEHLECADISMRLNHTYPKGWVGIGLLGLRLAEGLTSIVVSTTLIWNPAQPLLSAGYALQLFGGVLLVAGLWTPVAGPLQAAIEIWRAALTGSIGIAGVLSSAIGISLAMVGPGAWSVDARLYGRQRIDVHSLRD
jgi:uncharacterized membrane protein YphA (DoxX/SURF4 family)